MTESDEYSEISGRLAGLVTTVKALKNGDKKTWVYIVQGLRKFPESLELDHVYTLICGKIHRAQCKETDLSEVELDIKAGETALHLVTTIAKALYLNTYNGPFHQWLVNVDTQDFFTAGSALLLRIAQHEERKQTTINK